MTAYRSARGRVAAPSASHVGRPRAHRTAVRSLLGLALAVAAMALAACGSTQGSSDVSATDAQTVDTTPVARGGTFRLARSLEPVTLNPVVCGCENGSIQTIVQIFDTLVEFMPGTADAKPGLAERWDVSSDKKTFTFHLRDAKFSDGSPVTSADVKYSIDRVNVPSNSYYTIYRVIAGVDTPDRSTVVVRLKQPTPGFPWYLGFPAVSIVPKALVERLGDQAFAKHPVGSGAFMLKRWVAGQYVELVRNPQYWRRGQPYLDAVRMVYVPNDNTRTLDLISGNVDAVDAVPFSQVDQVNSSGQARVLFQASSGIYSVWFRTREKPLDDQILRQALNYATPLRQIQQSVFGGRVEVANSILPKTKDWSPAVKSYPYDLEKARALLARSKTPHGFDLTIELVGGDQTSAQVAQILQESWGKIGVKVKLRQQDAASVYARMQNGQYQAFMMAPDIFTSDLPITDEFAQMFFASTDSDQYSPTVARLAKAAIHSTDEAEQGRLFAKLQGVAMTEATAVPLMFPAYRSAARSNVHGFQYVQTGWWRLEQVSLAR